MEKTNFERAKEIESEIDSLDKTLSEIEFIAKV